MLVQSDAIIKVIRVPIPTPTLWPHTTTNSYIIGNENESLLVDAGYDQESTRQKLNQAIQENNLATPKKILITHSHPDHAPGVRQLVDWSPIVYCHELEKEAIANAISPVTNLVTIGHHDTLNIAGAQLQVIHGPGHTEGQLNLYIPLLKTLIAGDNIVAEGTTWIGPPEGNMQDYMNTLHTLNKLKMSQIGPGHGDWVHNPYEHIEFVIKRRIHREKQILAFLTDHEQLSSADLTKMIYEDSIHPSIFGVAQRTTEAHLIKLIEEKKVAKQDSQYAKINKDF